MNYTRFLNPVSLGRKPSPIRVLTAILSKSPPSMISLAAGSPNPELFPYKELEVTLRDGRKMKFEESQLKVGLQYGPSEGNAGLLGHIKKMVSELHKPPTLTKDKVNGGLDYCVTAGCQDAICKTFEMLVQTGDNLIMDVPTYPGTLAIVRPLGCNIVPVGTDQHGMVPESLREQLSRWRPSDAKDPASDIPRVMYTIPNGCNPTGSSLTTERKQQIYKIAQEYDLLIMEDDPYYFLQFTKDKAPSFLSMDVDGRVLRYDSFSKILSSGLRMGFMTGPAPLIQRIVLHQQVSVVHTSMLSQILVGQLLNEWGIEGFLEHVENVVDFYRSQKEVMISCANKHLSGLAEWSEPVAGMFLWMKLKGIKDTKKLIEERAMEKEVLLVPGCAFMPDPDEPCPYVRAAFSLATPQQIDQGLDRLASLIREEQNRNN